MKKLIVLVCGAAMMLPCYIISQEQATLAIDDEHEVADNNTQVCDEYANHFAKQCCLHMQSCIDAGGEVDFCVACFSYCTKRCPIVVWQDACPLLYLRSSGDLAERPRAFHEKRLPKQLNIIKR